MADNGRMATENAAAISLDLARLRRSCGECSLQGLCLPAGVDGDDLGRLDAVVQRRKPLRPGETLFRTGEPLGSYGIHVAMVHRITFGETGPVFEDVTHLLGAKWARATWLECLAFFEKAAS